VRPLPSRLLVVTDRASVPLRGRDGNWLTARHSGAPEANPESRTADDAEAGETVVSGSGVPLRVPGMTEGESRTRDGSDVRSSSTIDRGAEDSALLARIDDLLAGGARWVWFRERDMAPAPRALLARAVLERVRAGGGRFTLGGDAALAAHLGADGVHLPGNTTPDAIGHARRLLPDGLVGVSAHSITEIETAARSGADYATLSPIFATASKPGYGPALGTDALAAACGHGLPVLALGGITQDTARACRAAGATGIAVMGDLMRAPDPAPTLRALLSA